ncbi:FeoC-like transcriptional regulator [Alicyclobacillus macrosporangiidus]|uniref:FeoC-like transcriptional regulator n=1 Tax=Alicyclobacillus macrosporangiidus TaxID=392015 RepID=UPI00049867C0|nr:FeoC-like transcriptional regulator [Alicyclobacillus macrosporangiidus]
MLSRIEAAFAERKVWTIDGLAAHVGVSVEMVRAGIEQLKRMGRLTEDAAGRIEHCVNPSHACNRCAFQGLCLEESAHRAVTHVIQQPAQRPAKPGHQPQRNA